MNLENKKSIIVLKPEHLKKEFRPIISGIYDRNNLDKETQYFIDDFKKDAEFVDFYYQKNIIKENKIYNSGLETYVISLCNEKNKYSFSYRDCTGIVAVGVDKITGENISFLSHQNPDAFLADKEVRSNFKKDIEKDIDDLVSRCIPGSIDIVVFGGNKEDVSEKIPDENFRMGIDNIEDFLQGPFDTYVKSVKYLNYIIKQKIGFSPIVMSGPNDNFETDNHSVSVYFDNKNRRLYMIKPKQENSDKNEAFEASNVEEQIKKF